MRWSLVVVALVLAASGIIAFVLLRDREYQICAGQPCDPIFVQEHHGGLRLLVALITIVAVGVVFGLAVRWRRKPQDDQ